VPRRTGLGGRAEAFEILYDYKMGDLDIGEAYEAILNVSGQGYVTRRRERGRNVGNPHPKKRKLSAWNKFVKANSKKPRFVYRNGKLNLKKMGVAFRKTPAGKKKK